MICRRLLPFLALSLAACGGSSVTTDGTADFGPVGTALWLQFDVDDDAQGALVSDEVSHALLLTDVADACEVVTAAFDECEEAVEDDRQLTAQQRCELGDELYEDLADAFDPLYGASHRTLTAFVWRGDRIFDEPVRGAYAAGADPEDDGVGLRIDLFEENPFDLFADGWDEQTCGADPDLADALDVFVLDSGSLTVDSTDPLSGSGEGSLVDKDGDAAGGVNLSFTADVCEVRVRNDDHARCAGFAIPSLAFAAVGGTGTPGPDNVAACKAYVVQVNQAYADCDRNITVDADETCPTSLNDGRDCLDYFAELGDSYQCLEGEVTFTLPAEPCEPPA